MGDHDRAVNTDNEPPSLVERLFVTLPVLLLVMSVVVAAVLTAGVYGQTFFSGTTTSLIFGGVVGSLALVGMTRR